MLKYYTSVVLLNYLIAIVWLGINMIPGTQQISEKKKEIISVCSINEWKNHSKFFLPSYFSYFLCCSSSKPHSHFFSLIFSPSFNLISVIYSIHKDITKCWIKQKVRRKRSKGFSLAVSISFSTLIQQFTA